MNKPYIKALGAALYIVIVVSLMQGLGSSMAGKPDTVFAPMLMLSLLVISAAIMGWLFFYEPVKLIVENKKKEAISYFSQTLGTFAVFVIILAVVNMAISR